MFLLFGLILVVWGVVSLFRFTLSVFSYFLILVGFLLIIGFFLHHWIFSLILAAIIVYIVRSGKRRVVVEEQADTGFGRRDISDEAEQSDSK